MAGEDLTGPENWKARFRLSMFENGETPQGDIEEGMARALQWLELYSPLNPNYEKEQKTQIPY